MNREQARLKAQQIVSQMTLEEKASQLLFESPAIERLGIHPYNWWNEALHGVARADTATVFPQAIALAATFDENLVYSVADVISTEGRIKHNSSAKHGDYGIYRVLTFWSPNINIFRDPRWGRGQETYGEDPYLTSRIGVNFVKGLQGNGDFLKSAACAKHFAAHSGPEAKRHSFNCEVSLKDLWETYLPAFEALVNEAEVEGVMGAYTRLNGEPTCAHGYLMDEVLYKLWQFEGYFVSDCGAIADFHNGHKVCADAAESTALALGHKCNINCGLAYQAALEAVERGILTEETITENVISAYTTRVLLGEFDPTEYDDIPFEKLDCDEHRALNYKTACRSMVMLKNNGILPINDSADLKIGVMGPCADSIGSLEGNYCGTSSHYTTVLDGIRQAFPQSRIYYTKGCNHLTEENIGDIAKNHLAEALEVASHSNIVVLCLGLDATIEGEEIPGNNGYSSGGDRIVAALPELQRKFIRQIAEVNPNIVVVLTTGSAADIGDDEVELSQAIIQAWYPGAEGGRAVGDLLAGKFSPSGCLPITIPKLQTELPDIEDYSLQGRTYRYLTEQPRFPFGFGLSYAEFEYSGAEITSADQNLVTLSVDATNTSAVASHHITQVYAKYTDSDIVTPNFQLCGISSDDFAPGETKTLTINIPQYWLKAVNEQGQRVEPNQTITLYVGDCQPDKTSLKLKNTSCLTVNLK